MSDTELADAPVDVTSAPAAAPAPIPDTADARAARLEAATTELIDSDAAHALLVQVIDACGAIRNGITAGEKEFSDLFAHAKTALESAASRLGH